jgi:hypothetical protein
MSYRIPAILTLAVSLTVASGVRAADTDPGIYGRIDTGRFPKPLVINHKPVLLDRAARSRSAKPIYLHVRPGDEWHWNAHCKTYAACGAPVYFVTESWFMNVYLPAIGSRDGREQRYRIQAARERASERDRHDVHGED